MNYISVNSWRLASKQLSLSIAINHLPCEGNLWYVNNLMLHLHANWNVLIFHLKKNKQMKKFKPIFIMQIWAI